MAFFDRFKRWYLIKVRCYNCGHTQDCKVPKGITIDSHLRTEAAMCENCGNPTLRRIERVQAPAGTQSPLQEIVPITRHPTLPDLPPRRGPSRPIYRTRPVQQKPVPRRQQPTQRRPRRTEDNYVQYPVTEPVPTQEEENRPGFEQPEWNPQPKKINFWTGREEGR